MRVWGLKVQGFFLSAMGPGGSCSYVQGLGFRVQSTSAAVLQVGRRIQQSTRKPSIAKDIPDLNCKISSHEKKQDHQNINEQTIDSIMGTAKLESGGVCDYRAEGYYQGYCKGFYKCFQAQGRELSVQGIGVGSKVQGIEGCPGSCPKPQALNPSLVSMSIVLP